MSRVLEHLKEKQQILAGSLLVCLLQDSRHPAQERLSFLPCVSPLVMGLVDLGNALLGTELVESERAATQGRIWAVFRQDLRALGLDTASDLSGMAQLVWGEESSEARRLLYELMNLATEASPLMRQVIMLAVQAVANLMLPVVEQAAHELESRTGAKLTGFGQLRRQLDVGPWAVGAVELDLLPEMEQEAVETVEAVFALFSSMADQLHTVCEHKLEANAQRLHWELLATNVEHTSSLSFQEFGISRIQALCKSVGFGATETRTVEEVFSFMASTWGARRIGEAPPWKCDVTDDHTPYELSLALEDGRPEIRFLMEAQSKSGATTLQSSWDDGLALNERLNQAFGVPMERFKLVEDLFEPRNPTARFSLWHAFCLKPNGRPEFKVYLNPKARGLENSRELVKEALTRLGFTNAWRFVSEVAMRRGAKDQLCYFSLDLSGQSVSRVKIYLAHTDATAEDIEAVMSQAKEYVPGEAQAFCQKLQKEGRFNGNRSTLTCLAFTSDDDAKPYSVTLHCPIRCYVEHDGETMERLRTVLEPRSYSALDSAVKAMARRPLESAVGLIQWASMRREGGQLRTTFYLATEAYGIVVPRVVEPRPAELAQLSA
jgi:DMATS type aromatic prenyltransferase